jgi:hypothetical protein
VLGLAVAVSDALAAQDQLVKRLVERAIAKGDKDAQVGTLCAALSLPVKEAGFHASYCFRLHPL